ncbi:MAG TPA: hypothetical protein VFM48_06635 [Aquabacterium sp.]|nr:hypothetical protein [Aquabacterium sp.]
MTRLIYVALTIPAHLAGLAFQLLIAGPFMAGRATGSAVAIEVLTGRNIDSVLDDSDDSDTNV